MSRLKIAVYTIAKNEASHVERYAATTQGADVVVVTDTGSEDGTPDLLRDAAVQVHTARVLPWRFDVATNVALAHVPGDVDVCIKLDLDEVLFTCDGSSWREEIERVWRGPVNRVRYWYNWSWHVRGEIPAVRFRTANIHGRAGFVWRHPGHAALCCNDRGRETVNTRTLEIHHYPVAKRRPDYLALLQLAVRENRCPRTLYYLGREYYFRRLNEQAVSTLEEYLRHPEARWSAERADAMKLIGLTYRRMGQENKALSYLMQAISEHAGVRDLWYELLCHFHDTGDFKGGYWAGNRCLSISGRDDQYHGHSGDAWFDSPYILTAKCCWHVGQPEEAKTLVQQALALNGRSQRARQLAKTMGLRLPVQS